MDACLFASVTEHTTTTTTTTTTTLVLELVVHSCRTFGVRLCCSTSTEYVLDKLRLAQCVAVGRGVWASSSFCNDTAFKQLPRRGRHWRGGNLLAEQLTLRVNGQFFWTKGTRRK